MSSKMLQFVGTEKQMPTKRTAAERAKDFDEIYRDFSKERAESSLRFSFSRQNTFDELDAAVQILSEKIDFLNSMAVD